MSLFKIPQRLPMLWEFSKSHSVLCDLLPPLSPASSGLFPVPRASQMSRIHTCRSLYLNVPLRSGLATPAQSAFTLTWLSRESHPFISCGQTDSTGLTYPTATSLNYPLHHRSRVMAYLSSTWAPLTTETRYSPRETRYLHPDSQDAPPATKRSFCKPAPHLLLAVLNHCLHLFWAVRVPQDKETEFGSGCSCCKSASLFTALSLLHCICVLSPLCDIFMMSSAQQWLFGLAPSRAWWTGSLTEHGC